MKDVDLLKYIQHALDDYGDDGPTCAGHVLAPIDPYAGILKVKLWEAKKFEDSNSDLSLPADAEFEVTVRRTK